MKSFIRAITIIIVLTLIPADSAVAQNSAGTVSEPVASVVDVVKSAPASRPNVQLRTILSERIQQHDGGKVLVIPTTQIQPLEMVTLMEDMTVMCRIFDTKLAQANLRRGMPLIGVTLPRRFSLDSGSMGAMYIQGYGALFMTTVDFPLSPPPQTEEKEQTKDEDADPVWEQMKQEIFSPEQASRRASDRPEEKYDAEKVENLKATLIKALVHAANIRGLKPDESVILTVTGSGGDVSSNVGKVVAIKGTDQVIVQYKDKNTTKILKSPSLDDLDISLPTVLTIRAKKSYIDALAQQKIDYDEFEEKIQLISYPSLGQDIGGRLSPSFSFLSTGTTGYSVPTSTSVGVFEGRRSNRRRIRSSGTNVVIPSSSDRRDRR